jgi:hypothetical protein
MRPGAQEQHVCAQVHRPCIQCAVPQETSPGVQAVLGLGEDEHALALAWQVVLAAVRGREGPLGERQCLANQRPEQTTSARVSKKIEAG